MNSEYSEQGLILTAQRGDPEAYASLYESNVERVYHYLLRRMGQASDAEDVTTEVFIRPMGALPIYEFKGVPFVAWVFRIAHSTAVNQMNKQTRRQEVPLEGVSSDANDPSEQAIRQVTYQEVTGAMSGSPCRTRLSTPDSSASCRWRKRRRKCSTARSRLCSAF